MPTIEPRLAAVERQLRFHRAVIAGLLVALVALVGYGATKGVPDVIRAKRIEILNEKGKAVVTLGSINGLGSGIIEAYTMDGQRAVAITGVLLTGNVCTFYVDPDKPLAFHACLSGNRITLTSRPASDPGHDFRDLVSIDGGDNGGTLRAYNNDGGLGVGLSGQSPRGGGGTLAVFNKSAEPVALVQADEYGIGLVGAYDRQGQGRTLTPR
jgi:hypothetical protein